jgi:nucleoside 2-deoxyribosyltransferase
MGVDAVKEFPRVYLAGPDVFLPDAFAQSEAKKKLCAGYGFLGVSPVDNGVSVSEWSKRKAAALISEANERMIRGCQLLIANLTPFRSPSADVGTAYEMGFARALGLPVFGYTNVAGTLLERTRRLLGAAIALRPSGDLEDSHKMLIEDFDIEDNLMLVGAILAGGCEVVVSPTTERERFVGLAGFEACLQLAAGMLPKLPR